MNINQKVFAITEKATGKIVSFGINAKEVKEEWDEYYAGTEDEEKFMLQQTFMPQDKIRKEMGI